MATRNSKPTLEQARKRVAQQTRPVATEMVALAKAVGRICGSSYYAPYALPLFSQSLYDGFALGLPGGEEGGFLGYELRGEVAAGDTGKKMITPGMACRIMTGALVPRGTWKIIPQESCDEAGQRLKVEKGFADSLADNIRKKGSRVRKGSRVVTRGHRLSPMDMAHLADFGREEVEVYGLPTVHFFCTGSELVEMNAEKQPGKKYSSNRFQLAGLVQQTGATGVDYGCVDDERKSIAEKLAETASAEPTMIISTGGMGPGKYDLLEESFVRAGGITIFSALRLRPGKSILFGTLGSILYFGLPGPPPAVHALFHALVRPALLLAAGARNWRPKTLQARLSSEINIARGDTLTMHEAVLVQKEGILSVRLATSTEGPNCYLLCRAGKKSFRRGSTVTVLPLREGF